jgi:hypothetical protein
MKERHKKQVFMVIFVTAVVAALVLAPSVQALSFNCGDNFVNYVTVSGSLDLAKPGDTVIVNVSGKLAFNVTSQADTFNIKFFVDTLTEPQKTVTEGDLVLPADSSIGTAQYSIAIPTDVINNTYLYMSMNDGIRTYAQISITLIQNPTYPDLQFQVQNLQSTNNALQSINNNLRSSNNSLTTIVYIIAFIALIFVATTVSMLALTFRANKRRNQKAAPSASQQQTLAV